MAMKGEGMSEKKVVVPDGMLEAVREAERGNPNFENEDVVQAALRWLSENPIVPTDEQMMEFRNAWESEQWGKTQAGKGDFFAWCLTEWQRRMFRAAEPEVPEAVLQMARKHIIPDVLPAELKAFLDEYEAFKAKTTVTTGGCIAFYDAQDAVKDLLDPLDQENRFLVNNRIIEAYRRGQKSK